MPNFEKVKFDNEEVYVLRFRLSKVDRVNRLPMLEGKEMKSPKFVHWKSPLEDENATGDGQIWCMWVGDFKYVPMQRLTYKSGTPGQ